MSSSSRATVYGLAFAALLGSTRAHAEPKSVDDSSVKDEKARFAEAVRLYKADDFAAALPEFEALANETGSPNAQLYVGYCYVGLERPADAYAAFEQAARSAGSDERYAETSAAALNELSNLTLRISKIVVAPVEQPDGLVVKVDGVVVDPEAFGSHRVFAPGDHRVEASATDRDPIVRDIHVSAGETKTVTLYFPKREPAPPSPAPKPSGEANRGATLRTAGFVAAGVGGAGLVTFIVGGLQARSAYNDLERACGTTPCTDAAHQRDADRGKSWQTVANVGLVVGGIGVAASATLLYFGYRQGETSVALAPIEGGALFTGRARF
jgi:hypothetical protein